MLRSHRNHQHNETQVRAWSLPVQQWQQIQGPVSGWEEGAYIIIYPLLLCHHHHPSLFPGGFWSVLVDNWSTCRRKVRRPVRCRKKARAIKKAVRKGKTLRLLGLSIPFLSDPGKPGVRSLGPDVCPSQTNKLREVCKT